jgi:hypothetical protein
MFNNAVLDVFIGLVFLYLLYSLLATIIQEIFARRLSLRTRNLLKAIRIMLEDNNYESKNLRFLSSVNRYFLQIKKTILYWYKSFPKESFTKVFYKHPSIKYLGENEFRSKPPYIKADNFSQTLIQLLRGEDYDGTSPQMNLIYETLFTHKKISFKKSGSKATLSIEPETLLHLQNLYTDAHKDIDRFKILIEQWYNETMDRATGWYKKQTQLLLFFIGFGIAAAFNADTIAIYNILSENKTAREQLVQLAINAPEKFKPVMDSLKQIKVIDSIPQTRTDSIKTDTTGWIIREKVIYTITDSALQVSYKTIASDLENANNILGFGWPNEDSCEICDSLVAKLVCCKGDSSATMKLEKSIMDCHAKYKCNTNTYQQSGLQMFFGWLLTALAISLGAPFWYDMLNKIMQLRSGGPKPKGNDDNLSKTDKSNINRVG